MMAMYGNTLPYKRCLGIDYFTSTCICSWGLDRYTNKKTDIREYTFFNGAVAWKEFATTLAKALSVDPVAFCS